MPPTTRRPRKAPAPDPRGAVRRALDDAIGNATHLLPTDEAVIAAARSLADRIDHWDVIVGWAMDDAAKKPAGARPAVPANDNTSLPTFLRYCEALGLTPAARAQQAKPKGGATGGGKLSLLQGQARGTRSA